MFIKQVQLGLIHMAVAITLVPINSTLNRVMIKEMALSATLVAVLASLPYLFSPAQMVIGNFSDRHPWLGWRRSPYILFGLLLCAAGVSIAPLVVFILPSDYFLGLALSILVFGAWGMGFNIASVGYFSLATELSGERNRSKTVAIMFVMMILGIILTSVSLSHQLEAYSPAVLERAFQTVGLAALLLGGIGLAGLEPRHRQILGAPAAERTSWLLLVQTVMGSSQSRLFFIYLILLLVAILGQDILLEPFAAEAFDLPVAATTRITSIWGVCTLACMLVTGFLENRFNKRKIAAFSAWVAASGFALIAASGFLTSLPVFYTGLVLLGAGTGLSTVSNLSLMLDMTTTQVGLFIGAWGMANAMARMLGTLLSGILRDLIGQVLHNMVLAYTAVFLIQMSFLLVSLVLLSRVDVTVFRQQQAQKLKLAERAALMNDSL